jgi:hypothetical protein
MMLALRPIPARLLVQFRLAASDRLERPSSKAGLVPVVSVWRPGLSSRRMRMGLLAVKRHHAPDAGRGLSGTATPPPSGGERRCDGDS